MIKILTLEAMSFTKYTWLNPPSARSSSFYGHQTARQGLIRFEHFRTNHQVCEWYLDSVIPYNNFLEIDTQNGIQC